MASNVTQDSGNSEFLSCIGRMRLGALYDPSQSNYLQTYEPLPGPMSPKSCFFFPNTTLFKDLD